MNDFFLRIEDLLTKQNKTQKEFSEAVGFAAPQAYITQRNRGSYPKADMALKMAQYLDTTVEYLITGKESDTYKEKFKNLLSDMQKVLDSNK